jgi:uncharacterized protein (DUF1330 family)
MKRLTAIGLALITSIPIGVATGYQLHAQTKSPVAYVVVDVSEITDPELFKQIGPKSGLAATAAGGRILARTDNIIALSGTAPKRFVIIAFDSIEKARAFDITPAQLEVNALTERAIKARRFIVEGIPD